MNASFTRHKNLIGYFTALSGVVAVTSILVPFRDGINTTIVALALLLVTLLVATIFGSRPAFLSSFLGVLTFNFFFLPPYHTLTIADPQNWVALAVFLIVAVTVGQLSAKARNRAEEAERLYGELQAAFEKASQAEALRQSEKLKSSLLDAVTHDLRTPLTSIKAAATTLLEDKRERFLDGEGRKEFLDIINEETDRLNKFIEGMVGLARVEANALQDRKCWGPVDEIISNAIERAKGQLTSRHIHIELERDLPSLFVDSGLISEVVYTLLDNAAKYSPEGSRIGISARRSGAEMIEIAVEDQGRGIEPAMREKVFSKFFRTENEGIHTTSDGLGLGLAIARGIIESQGGRIWIADGTGGYNTRVAFVIPIGDEEK